MKKLLTWALALTLMCGTVATFTGCGADRSEQLKIYAPGEYISPEVKDAFETWYEDQTGNPIEVVEDNFDTVEEIMTQIEMDRADYDLALPSDYYVERMIDKGLLLETGIDVTDIIKPEYIEQSRVSDPEMKYSVPYMYGTFGIMYDYSKTGEHITSWQAIFAGGDYEKKSSTKASVREAYTSALIYNVRDALSAASAGFTDYGADYQAALQALYSDVSEASVAAARTTLEAQRSYIVKWDEEDVKFSMAGGNSDIEVALMWSCDAGYVMNDYEDDNGEEHTGNRNLWYVIPEEGGNIYMDCFVIPKYAANVDAARMFLQFICMKDNAILSSEWAGAISPVSEAYDELYAQYTAEAAEAPAEQKDWYDMYLDMLFPGAETRARCGIMRDYGDDESRVITMFNDVCPVA